MKTCPRCRQEKPESEYYVLKTGRLKSQCKTCCSEMNREWKARHPKQPKKRKPEGDTKVCTLCKIEKPLAEFNRRQSPNGDWRHQSRCKVCQAALHREWKRANPEKHREQARRWRHSEKGRAWRRKNYRKHHLKQRYGITLDEYDAMLEAQGGGCAICAGPPPEDGFLPVDHCHGSLKVRGLLCTDCNRGLGLFRDDPKLLERAADYLRAA